MAGPILLPTPLALDSLSLGQLISDPLDTSSPSFISPSTTHSQGQRRLQSRYKDVVSHDNEGRLISSLAGRSLHPSQENILLVQADEMEHTSLKHASAAFDSLRQDTAAQTFFRKMALRNQPLYYVVGIQKLKNPVFKRAVVKEGSITEASTSADPKIRLPMHVRRDSGTDLAASSTDGVFGIEVRKVKCRVGSADEPHSLDDLPFSWSYHKLDTEPDIQLSIGLGRALEAAELSALAGIVSDEDFTDESHDSESDEDEQAGF